MNFGKVELDERRLAFIRDVRAVLARHWVPDPDVLALDHHWPTPELIEVLAERGWIHPCHAKEDGGAGLGPVEARLLELLFDAYRVPSYGNQFLLPTLDRYGSAELKAEVMHDLKSGRTSFCLGYTEPDSGSDMAAARTRAIRDGDEWVINGSKMFTTWAQQADYVFLLARTGTVQEKHRGLTVFLVPMRAEGVEVQPVIGMGGVRTNITYYRDVRVHDRYRLGAVGDGWKVVSGPLASEHGADAPDPLGDLNGPMGAAFTRTLARLVERTVDWAIVPDPATGEPPIDDPLVRSALTAALLDIEVCRSTPPSYGKVAASAALARHAEALLDLTAPAGLLDGDAPGTVEHGVIAWARLFAPATDIYGGTSEMYRNNLARGVLGLPRPR